MVFEPKQTMAHVAANGRGEPIAEVSISRCVRLQRGICCNIIIFAPLCGRKTGHSCVPQRERQGEGSSCAECRFCIRAVFLGNGVMFNFVSDLTRAEAVSCMCKFHHGNATRVVDLL